MKRTLGLLAAPVFILSLSLPSSIHAEETPKEAPRINEVLPNPEGSDADNEFVEIKNPQKKNLAGWNIVYQKSSESRSNADRFEISKEIDTSQTFLVFPYSKTKEYLVNSEMRVSLENANGKTIGSGLSYTNPEEGNSYGYGTDTKDVQTTKKLTPGKENIFPSSEKEVSNEKEKTTSEEKSPQDSYSEHIRIQRLKPNPKEAPESEHEVLVLKNHGNKAVSLADWTMYRRMAYELQPRKGSLPETTLGPGEELQVSSSVPALINSPEYEVWLSVGTPDGTITHTVSYTKTPEGATLSYDPEKTEMTWKHLPQNTFENNAQKEKNNQAIRLSEVLPAPFGDPDNEFVELHNTSDKDTALKDWTLTDGTSEFTFTKYDRISKDGYLIFDKNRTGIALNNTGEETISLKNPSGKTVDTLSYKDALRGQSYAKNTGGKWQWTANRTPQTANSFAELKLTEIQESPESEKKSERSQSSEEKNSDSKRKVSTPQALQITEVFPDPENLSDRKGEFIELQNTSSETVDTKNWRLAFHEADKSLTKAKKIALSSRSLSKDSYRTFLSSEYSPVLTNSGSVVKLLTPRGKVVDSVTYSEASPAKSYARSEKTGKFQWTADVTAGTENSFTNKKQEHKEISTPNSDQHISQTVNSKDIRITELRPDPNMLPDSHGELIEIHNTSSRTFDISEWTVENSSVTASVEKTSLTGMLEADEYVTFLSADVSFTLPNQPTKVILRKDDGEILDQVSYQNVSPGVSYSYNLDKNSYVWTDSVTVNAPYKNSKKEQNSDNSSGEKEYTPPQEETIETDLDISLNEVFPYPKEKQGEEFIELKVEEKNTYSLEQWELNDGTSSVTLEGKQRNTTYPTFKRSQTDIALNNHSEETLTLIDSNGEIHDSVTLSEQVHGAAYALNNEEGQWTSQPTPQASNIIQKPEDEEDKSQSDNEHASYSQVNLDEVFQTKHEKRVEVTGTVYIPPHTVSNRFFVLTTGERSIKVYNFSQEFPHMEHGNTVTVKGKVYRKYQETRLTTGRENISVHKGRTDQRPLSVSANQIQLSPRIHQGHRVEMTGELLEQSGDSFYVKTPVNNQLRITALSASNFTKPDMRAGDTISIRGLVDVYRDDLRVLVWNDKQVMLEKSGQSTNSEEEKQEEKTSPSDISQTTSSSSQNTDYSLDELTDNGTISQSRATLSSFTSSVDVETLLALLPTWLRTYPFHGSAAILSGLWFIGEVFLLLFRRF